MIKELLYNYFEDNIKQKEMMYIDDGKEVNYAPSYLTDCCRKIYYKKTGEKGIEDPHSYIKFAMGDAVHEKITELIKKISNNDNKIKWIEGEDFKEKNLYGLKWIYKIDNMIEVNDKRYIIEVKSIYANGWYAIEKEARIKDILQLYMYMLLEDVQRGILFYIGRDNGYMLEYSYELHIADIENIIQKYIQEMKKLKTKIENKEIPERNYTIYIKKINDGLYYNFQKNNIKYNSNYQCNYCKYFQLCWKDVIEKMKDFKYYINNKFYKED